MKKILVILLAFIFYAISADAQNDCNLAKVGAVSIINLNDSTKAISVGISLTQKGRQSLKKGRSISCSLHAFFVDASKHLKTTTQVVSLKSTSISNRFIFEINNDESAKLLESMFLKGDDFRISCY